jgi:hypothetical protein
VPSLKAAFQSFISRLKQQVGRESFQVKEKLKDSKQKRDHRGRRPSRPINWRVLLSQEIQRCLPDHKTEAIIRYRQLTGADVQDAEQTIGYHIAYPNQVPANFRHEGLSDEQILSLYQMLRHGKREEAHKQYQAITGLDQFAADVGLDVLEQDVLIQEEYFASLRNVVDAKSGEVQSDQYVPRDQKG